MVGDYRNINMGVFNMKKDVLVTIHMDEAKWSIVVKAVDLKTGTLLVEVSGLSLDETGEMLSHVAHLHKSFKSEHDVPRYFNNLYTSSISHKTVVGIYDFA